jgi:hypothetical protein
LFRIDIGYRYDITAKANYSFKVASVSTILNDKNLTEAYLKQVFNDELDEFEKMIIQDSEMKGIKFIPLLKKYLTPNRLSQYVREELRKFLPR